MSQLSRMYHRNSELYRDSKGVLRVLRECGNCHEKFVEAPEAALFWASMGKVYDGFVYPQGLCGRCLRVLASDFMKDKTLRKVNI